MDSRFYKDITNRYALTSFLDNVNNIRGTLYIALGGHSKFAWLLFKDSKGLISMAHVLLPTDWTSSQP